MADGDLIVRTRDVLHVKLLDGAGATDDGVWVETGSYRNGTVHVTGITTATVQVRGSSEFTVPDNATHGYQIGSDLTADGAVGLTDAPKWVKARVSAYTSGTIDAALHLRIGVGS